MHYNILTSISVNEQLLYDKEMKRYNQKYKPIMLQLQRGRG